MRGSLFVGLLCVGSVAAQVQFRQTALPDQPVFEAVFCDLDIDGAPDLLVARLGDVVWQRNDGRGGFDELPLPTPGLGTAPGFVVGDFDGDGAEDGLVVGRGFAGSHLLRSRAPLPEPVDLRLPARTSNQIYDLTTIDLEGDGDLDVLVFEPFTALWVLRNDGTGGMTLAQLASLSGAFALPGAAVGDFDSDGDDDVCSANVFSVGYWRNDGGRLVAAPGALPAPRSATRVLAGDFDGDGNDDVLLFDDATQVARLWSGGPSGLRETGSFPSPAYFELAAIDVDEDGDLDVLGTGYGSSAPRSLTLLLNDGVGGFSDASSTRIERLPPGLLRLAVGDVDRDGDLDVFVGGLFLPIPGAALVVRNHHRQVTVPAAASVGGSLQIVVSRAPGYGTGYGLALPALGPAAAAPVPTVFGPLFLDPSSALSQPFVSLPAPIGEGRLWIPVPANPALAGTEFLVQALILEPFGPGAPRLTGFARAVVQ